MASYKHVVSNTINSPPGRGNPEGGRGPLDVYPVRNDLRDLSGRRTVNSAFGELHVAQRNADISVAFLYGLSTGSGGDVVVSGSDGGNAVVSASMIHITSSTDTARRCACTLKEICDIRSRS